MPEKSPQQAKRPSDSTKKPKSIALLIVGLLLIIAPLVWYEWIRPDARVVPLAFATLVSVGMASILYWMNPRPGNYKGNFKGLVVLGPAALAVFLFLTIFYTMSNSVGQSSDGAPKLELLTSGDRVSIGNDSIEVVGADTLSDKRLCDGLTRIIGDLGEAPDPRAAAVAGLEKILPAYPLIQAKDLVERAAQQCASAKNDVDQEWANLVDKAGGDQFKTKIKRLPFAIIEVTPKGGAPNYEFLLTDQDIELGQSSRNSVKVVAIAIVSSKVKEEDRVVVAVS
ncbi:MAG TPA: hypothetical protein VKB38_24350 [Terracidiphilus sp.]|nr:hypothetical protein [Terracidiphilus sp.]